MPHALSFDRREIHCSIPKRFQRVVAHFPHRLALKCAQNQFTYQELNTASNAVAHAILSILGEQPEPVALLFDHSSDLVVSLMGVLKAGKAYLVLDPSAPISRLSGILSNAQVRLVIAGKGYDQPVSQLSQTARRSISYDFALSSFPGAPVKLDLPQPSLAGIFYTSGSTGEPKGVGRTHAQMLHYAWINIQNYKIVPSDRQSLISFLGFAGSVSDVFHALLSGAGLYLFSPWEASLDDMIDWLRRESITIFHPSVSLFRQLLERINAARGLENLRMVILAGQTIYRQDVIRFRQFFPTDCVMVNRYGLSEVGAVAQFFVDCQTEWEGDTLPVGYPVQDVEILVLDEAGQSVVPGQTGEVVVRSHFLAPGYLHDRELSDKVFVSDPEHAGQRLYFTGDLGRIQADGCLLHLGRKDFRVKVRGFRVELSAIEAALMALPGINQAVVLAQPLETGDHQLVAYLVPAGDVPITTSHIRSALAASLPDYMFPSFILWIARLPLTANGKIDRRSLPNPGSSRPNLLTSYEPPQTALQAQLADLWAAILRLDRVGIHDNFFELGGNSLLVNQVLSRVADLFHIRLSPREFFNAPTVSELSIKIQTVPCTEQMPYQPIQRRQLASAYPLSFSQQRIWFMDQIEPHALIYNMPKAYRIIGPLDVAALRMALEQVVGRHEVFRTIIEVRDGQPVQVIRPQGQVDLVEADLRIWSGAQQAAQMERLLAQAIQQPYDLAIDPVLRPFLFRLSDHEYHLLLVSHHVATDWWSRSILMSEISEFYRAAWENQPACLPQLLIQYADYAVWQQQRLQDGSLAEQLVWWCQQLKGAPAILELPTDYPRPARLGYQGGRVSLQLASEAAKALNELSSRQGTTLFMLFLAAWQVLLYRYTGATDIPVGMPVSGRTRTEIETLIGCFINSLVLRTDLSGSPSFIEILNRVRKVALEAYAHQDLPFERLLEQLAPQRMQNRHALFQVMIDFLAAPQELRLVDLQVSELEIQNHTSEFDLTLYIREAASGVKLILEYNLELFSAATAQRLLSHLKNILDAAVAFPEYSIDEIQMLTSRELRQILTEWNQTDLDYPRDLSVSQLIEAQSQRTPESLAVVLADSIPLHRDLRSDTTSASWGLTYRQLNSRANQLARYLRNLGVTPGTLVGVCVERSLEMVVGLLGILKAGAAYVPIDPAWPPERISFVLKDTHLLVLLTQQQLVTSLELISVKLVCLDSDWEYISHENEQNLDGPVTAHHLAYVMYTSGSTGTPKGTLVEHHSLVNHAVWMQTFLDLRSQDNVLQMAPLTFDVSASEIFDTLLAGARLVLAASLRQKEVDYLVKTISQAEINILQAVPSLLAILADHPRLQDCTSLRHILCGGEEMPPDLPQRGFSRLNVVLHNMYGPTEACIDATHWLCQPGEVPASLPIGCPIANTQVYVLDRRLHPVPLGVPGELYIGGDALARGYLDRPELTAQVFLPDPFGSAQGARLYRTGDLVKYLPDGNLQFLGRLDRQVKLRGFRVELGEIESVLSQHPAVKQVLVTLQKSPLASFSQLGDAKLVAFIVPRPGAPPEAEELHRFLRAYLPDYMHPSFYVFLQAFPLLPNGKVNLQALPSSELSVSTRQAVSIMPRTSLEQVVAGVWADLLKCECVGVLDNFFDLGGHSLLAIQLINRLNDLFQVQLPLRLIFDAPTVESFASLLRQFSDEPGRVDRTAQLILQLAELSESDAQDLVDDRKVDLH